MGADKRYKYSDISHNYLEYANVKKLSPRTSGEVLRDFSKFVNHLDVAFHGSLPYPCTLTPPLVYSWLASLPLAQNTTRRIITSTRQLFRLAWNHQVITRYPPLCDLIPPPPILRKRDVLTVEELKKIRSSLQDASPTRVLLRHRVIFELLLLGLRVSELCVLKWTDIKKDHFEIRIPKTKEHRAFPMTENLKEAVEEWRSAAPPDTVRILEWKPRSAGKIYPQSISRTIQSMLKRAGVERESYAGTHLFRHSMGTLVYREFEDYEKVRMLLGHKSIETSRRYVHVAPVDLAKITDRLDDMLK